MRKAYYTFGMFFQVLGTRNFESPTRLNFLDKFLSVVLSDSLSDYISHWLSSESPSKLCASSIVSRKNTTSRLCFCGVFFFAIYTRPPRSPGSLLLQALTQPYKYVHTCPLSCSLRHSSHSRKYANNSKNTSNSKHPLASICCLCFLQYML